MLLVAKVVLRGILRDRVFQGIMTASLLFFFIPVLSKFTMRQVTELSITLSLSLISFLLLLLAVFLGGTSLWRDIERRYTYSVLGLPLSRERFLLGKFLGISFFIVLIAVVLGSLAFLDIWFVAQNYQAQRPVAWDNIFIAITFEALKYILLVAVSFVFSAVSTSFFLPIFGTLATFAVGSVSQQAYDYLSTTAAMKLPEIVKISVGLLYWAVPNFSAFDVKVNAIYSLELSMSSCLDVVVYWFTYTMIVLLLASWFFKRREML